MVPRGKEVFKSSITLSLYFCRKFYSAFSAYIAFQRRLRNEETSSFANHFISADFRRRSTRIGDPDQFWQCQVRDIRFMGSNGTEMSALLYIPKGVTAKNPAPGIVAIHGYINSRETQDGFAIEFARRGYVVLAPDQTGHGYSDPPAFGNGFGGPDSLVYLRSLDIVDKNNIGLEGHSMGGWAIGDAAGAFPNDYKSFILEGSSTGTLGAPDGTRLSPRTSHWSTRNLTSSHN